MKQKSWFTNFGNIGYQSINGRHIGIGIGPNKPYWSISIFKYWGTPTRTPRRHTIGEALARPCLMKTVKLLRGEASEAKRIYLSGVVSDLQSWSQNKNNSRATHGGGADKRRWVTFVFMPYNKRVETGLPFCMAQSSAYTIRRKTFHNAPRVA